MSLRELFPSTLSSSNGASSSAFWAGPAAQCCPPLSVGLVGASVADRVPGTPRRPSWETPGEPFLCAFHRRCQTGSDNLGQTLWPHFPLWYMPDFGLAPTIPQPPGNSRTVASAQISAALPGHLILISSLHHLLSSSCFLNLALCLSVPARDGKWDVTSPPCPSVVTSRSDDRFAQEEPRMGTALVLQK